MPFREPVTCSIVIKDRFNFNQTAYFACDETIFECSSELRQSAEGVDVLPDVPGDGGGGGDGSSGNNSDADDGGPAGELMINIVHC